MLPDEQISTIQFFIDKVRAPRFGINSHYVPALNQAMEDFINDRYDNIKDENNKVSFESVERVRDELYSIIREVDLVPTANVTVQPSDYRYEVGMRSRINGIEFRSEQITYNEFDDIVLGYNAFTKPAQSDQNVYHLKTATGFKAEYGATTGLTNMHLRYIKQSTLIVRSEVPIITGGTLVVGFMYYVTSGSVIQGVNVYSTGQAFVATSTVVIGGGVVVLIVPCELPPNTHREICKRAANILMGTVDDYQKMQEIKAQEKIS